MELKFRDLTENDIECRVQSCGESLKGGWARVLLYKDARVDQNILDETVGAENWQRDHKELKGNIYCGVSIKFDCKDGFYWVTKWDCGAESNTEKEKGEASDSFKRACFNWGIGRELYTKIPLAIYGLPMKEVNGKKNVDGVFEVEKIKVEKKPSGKEITALSLTFKKGYDEPKRCFIWTAEKGVQLCNYKEN